MYISIYEKWCGHFCIHTSCSEETFIDRRNLQVPWKPEGKRGHVGQSAYETVGAILVHCNHLHYMIVQGLHPELQPRKSNLHWQELCFHNSLG